MDPFFARNRLSSYLDGTLSDAEAAEVSEAIEHDPSLKEEYEALRRAVNFIKRAGPTEAPADFHAKVLARVAAEKAPGGRLVWLSRPLSRVPLEAIGVAAAALLVVLFVSQHHRAEVAAEKAAEENAQALARDANLPSPPPAPPVVVTPAEPPALAMKVPGDAIATGSASGRAETPYTMPSSVAGAKGSEDQQIAVPTQNQKQAPKTGYSADNPFVPEWEKQAGNEAANEAANEEAAQGFGPTGVPPVDEGANTANTANTGATNQALSNGVAVAAVYGYALRISSASTLTDLGRSVEALGGKLVDASGARIDPSSFGDDNRPALVRAIVKPGDTDAMTTLLAKYGAASKTRPPSAAEFASDHVEFDLAITYAP